MTTRPSCRLMGDKRPQDIRTTHREIDRDRRPGARTHHDGGRSPQVLQNGGGIGRVSRNQANGLAASPGVTRRS